MKAIFQVCLIVSILGLSACGDAFYGDDGSSIYDGDWWNVCLPQVDADGDGLLDDSRKTRLFINGSILVSVDLNYYDDATACNGANLKVDTTATYKVSYSGGKDLLLDTATVSGDKVTLELTAQAITLLDATLAAQWNASQAYGYSDWSLNIPKDILGRDPVTGLLGVLELEKIAIHLDSAGALYRGLDTSGSSDGFPDVLEHNNPFSQP